MCVCVYKCVNGGGGNGDDDHHHHHFMFSGLIILEPSGTAPIDDDQNGSNLWRHLTIDFNVEYIDPMNIVHMYNTFNCIWLLLNRLYISQPPPPPQPLLGDIIASSRVSRRCFYSFFFF